MRLLHTADWHLGRRLKGVDRTPELALVLDELLAQAKILEVDAVLMAGDLFDIPNPPAEAERVAYQFFYGLQQAKIPAILIAGNHDSAVRIDGIANILSLAGVEARGRPCFAQQGGIVNINTPGGQLRVGALPFASERRLLTSEHLWEKDDVEQRQLYREMVGKILQNLARDFRSDSINILTAHLAIDGARLAQSEVQFYTLNAYALSEQILPPEAQYIALGHIHTPQRINAAAPTYYSGSLIQVDFGEAGETKGFNLINVEKGRPAQVEFRPLSIHKPLKVLRCSTQDLDDQLESNRHHPGYLKVIIQLETPAVGLADRVRKICPQALIVEPRYPIIAKSTARATESGPFDPLDAFGHYYRDQLNLIPNPQVLTTFQSLYTELNDAPH